MQPEEPNRKGRPGKPRPQLQPARQRLVHFYFQAHQGRSVRSFDGHLGIPPSRFRQLKDGRTEEFVGRCFFRGWKFQYLSSFAAS
jgi:hypothetical protein